MTARSHRKGKISPPDHAQKNGIGGVTIPKKEARPFGPGDSLCVAAQYIQKTPKNNGLFGIWLAEIGGKPGFYGRRKTVIGGAAAQFPR
jgi:hypothetical protein